MRRNVSIFLRMRPILTLAILATAASCSSMHATSTSANAPGQGNALPDDRPLGRGSLHRPVDQWTTAKLYVRERATAAAMTRGGAGVVLFVHGAGTPAEVAFDAPGDYSWMGFSNT